MLSGDMSPGISRRTKTAGERIISLYFQQLLCIQLSISNFRKAVTKYFINSSLLYNSPKWLSLLDSKFFLGALNFVLRTLERNPSRLNLASLALPVPTFFWSFHASFTF